MFERILKWFGYERRRVILWPHNAARRRYREVSENQRLRLEIARLRKKLEASRKFSRSLGSRFVSVEEHLSVLYKLRVAEAHIGVARRGRDEARQEADRLRKKLQK